MNDFIQAFSNREISITLWSSLVLSYFFFINIKGSFSLIADFFSKQLIPFYLIFGVYFYYIIKILKSYNVWENALYKDFLIWFITTALVMFFNSNKLNAYKDFRIIVVKLLSLNIIIEFVANFYNFSLLGELLFIPIISFITLLYIFSNTYKEKPGYLQVSKFLNFMLIVISLAMIIYVTKRVISSYDQMLSISNFKSLLFTPFLTLLFIPIIYLTVIFMRYQDIFINLKLSKYLDKKRKRRIKYSIFLYGNINLTYLNNAKSLISLRKHELKNRQNVQKYIRRTIKKEVIFKE